MAKAKKTATPKKAAAPKKTAPSGGSKTDMLRRQREEMAERRAAKPNGKK